MFLHRCLGQLEQLLVVVGLADTGGEVFDMQLRRRALNVILGAVVSVGDRGSVLLAGFISFSITLPLSTSSLRSFNL